MIMARSFLFAATVMIYGWLFTLQEHKAEARDISLDMALPATFYKIAAGYAKQLASEMLFIRTSVFLGGVRPGTPPTSYADTLGNNFEVMTQLYPRFIDPYYFCKSFLPHISPEAASSASNIFSTGIAAHPDDLMLRFFHGTNYFLALNEPLKGAEAFAAAAKLPEAPPLFAHLAALLSAQGGDIAAGLISLKAMLASEKDEVVLTRYEEEIVIFEQALEVQKALNSYIGKYGTSPNTLNQLVPEFITSIPDIRDSFVLVYNPPNLRLQRPDK
jgi:hypothetical protein